MKTIGIYSGGFKPPTGGHFEVVEKAVATKNFDEFIILVGQGERDGITQQDAFDIWDIYKGFLPAGPKYIIKKVESNMQPIRVVYTTAREDQENEYTWFLGIRDGNQGDEKDVLDRTATLRRDNEGKYKNLTFDVVKTADKISGTKARAALAKGSQTAFNLYLPNEIGKENKDLIWGMLYSDPEQLDEKKRKGVTQAPTYTYNQETLYWTRYIFKQFQKYYPKGQDFGEERATSALRSRGGTEVDYELNFEFNADGDEVFPRPFVMEGDAGWNEENEVWDIKIECTYDPDAYPAANKKLYEELKDTIRHELEHIGQMVFLGKEEVDARVGTMPYVEYFTLSHEIPAFVKGLYAKAKSRKQPLNKVIDEFLDEYYEGFNDPEIEMATVKDAWIDWAEDNLPAAVIEAEKTKYPKGTSGDPFGLKAYAHELAMLSKIEENKEGKTLYAFDLDDTLITSKSYVKVTHADGETSEMLPSQYATYKPQSGDKFDYSDFDSLNSPQVIAKNFSDFVKILKTLTGKGDKAIILTARQSEVSEDVYDFLRDFGITGVDVYAVNSSDPQKKMDVLKDFASKGYTRINFYDDSPKNVRAANELNKTIGSDITLTAKLVTYSSGLKEQLTENMTYKNHVDIDALMASLTERLMEELMLEVAPSVEFVDGDVDNAKVGLGSTAYYDPNNNHIVLYTEGRHPKDILRSYAHEFVHHAQNMEGRIPNIQTQNVNEDEALAEIEREAYERGNMIFRSWENSLKV